MGRKGGLVRGPKTARRTVNRPTTRPPLALRGKHRHRLGPKWADRADRTRGTKRPVPRITQSNKSMGGETSNDRAGLIRPGGSLFFRSNVPTDGLNGKKSRVD